jgi:phage-related protein
MAYDLGTAHGKIELEYTGKSEVDAADRDMKRLGKNSKETDGHLRKLGQTLKVLGKGAAFAGLAVGATNAAAAAANIGVQLLGAVPALTSLLSLSAALPGAFVAAGAAVGVLKASLAGVGEAVQAAFDTEHPEKFDEAIKKLSPSAAAFATAIRDASAGLREYQQGLQESFFRSAALAQQVPQMTAALQAIRPQLTGLAGDFGNVTRTITSFATSGNTITFVRNAVNSLRTAVADLQPALGPILVGLRSVGEVGLPLLNQLSAAAGRVGKSFGEWLQEVSSNGQLQEWINTALTTLRELGSIASNVGGILASIFRAAGEAGGGLLGTLSAVTGELNRFLSSAEGQQALISLFTGIGAVAKQLAPVISTLVGALAGALGPALMDLATNTGPVLLQVVQALSPAFGPLANAIVAVVNAIAPSLPAIAQLVTMLAQLAAGVLTTLASNLKPIITLLGSALSGALTALAPVLDQLIAQFPQFASAGLQIAQALLPLVPAVIQFATALASALLPYLPQLVDAFLQLVPPLVQVASIMAGQLAAALTAIIPYLPQIIGFAVGMQTSILSLVGAGLRFLGWLLQLGQALMRIPSIVSGALSSFGTFFVNAFNTARTAVSNGITAVLGFFSALPGRIGGFLSRLPGVIGGIISTAVHEMAFRFGQGIGIVISAAIAFPGKVRSAVTALPGILSNLARSAWNAVKSAFSAGVTGAVNFARGLPGKARSAISSLGGLLSGLARSAWSALKNAFSSGVSSAASTASSLPGRIRSAVGNLGSLLVSAGRDAVMGLVNGIKGAIGAAVNAAASVGGAVVSGIKSKLKISSPSRVMIQIGRFVTQGLRNGLLGTAKQVQSAANKLANMVRDAFSDKLIKRGQRNSVLGTLSRGTKQLVTLVNRSNAIAARLKTAQTNLTAAKKAYDEQYASAVKQTKESFNLVSDGQNFVNLDLTKQRFQDAVKQAQQFAKDIAALTKKGLNKDLIAQLAAAGADGGGAMARALAGADAATIKEFNKLQGQLNTAANTVGKTTADALYGAGLRAAQGIVNGLKSQQKAIDKQMLAIANSMVKAIKKALKIKSPSRIMFSLGKFTTQGLIRGLEALRNQVRQAAQKLATSAIIPTVQLGLNPGSAGGQQPTVAPGGVGGTTNVFNQTVNALPGMSARQVADYSLTKLRFGLTTGVSSAPIPAPLPAGV